jgi:hypothetical protein
LKKWFIFVKNRTKNDSTLIFFLNEETCLIKDKKKLKLANPISVIVYFFQVIAKNILEDKEFGLRIFSKNEK